MNNLRVTTIQAALAWEDIAANLQAFEQKMQGLKGKTDLIILPEMFSTGFSMHPANLAESMEGQAVQWMQAQAQKLNAVITGSLMIREGNLYFNRLIWMCPDGTFSSYDKRHLFTMAKEQEAYQAGTTHLYVEVKGWRVCPLICYDLRFPVWSRNTTGYDLLIYVANWPEKRNYAWKSLLQARAIENQAWTIGVNRVGKDGNDWYYSGDTSIIEPSGEKIIYSCAHEEAVFTTELSHEYLTQIRQTLPFLNDQDAFELLIT